MGVSRKLESAWGMGLATLFVLTLASVLSFLANTYLLAPFDAGFLRIIVYILIIAAVVQFTEIFMRRYSPVLHAVLGLYLPLITTNCAVLGVALLSTRENHNFEQALFYGFGAALGFMLVLVLFSAMRERLDAADIPKPFRGNAVALITAGIMSLAFMGFSGVA